MKKFLGYTWVGWLNIMVLQWFFIRLQYSIDYEGDPTPKNFMLLRGIVPLTGWLTNYIWVIPRKWTGLNVK